MNPVREWLHHQRWRTRWWHRWYVTEAVTGAIWAGLDADEWVVSSHITRRAAVRASGHHHRYGIRQRHDWDQEHWT